MRLCLPLLFPICRTLGVNIECSTVPRGTYWEVVILPVRTLVLLGEGLRVGNMLDG